MLDRANERRKMAVTKKLSPFDFINAINSSSKQNLMEDPEAKKQYLPYIVNRQFSYFQDTVLLANEMNSNHRLDQQMQYDFLRYTVRPRKRFSRWIKPEEIEDLDVVSKYYKINREKAKVALKILTPSAIKSLRAAVFCGGLKKNK